MRRLAVVLLAFAVTGCGGSDRPDTIPVRGHLTYDGGDWPMPGRIYFTPLEPAEGFPRRPGTANFDTDGRFSAKTWEDGDGLMPGKYRISIECWKVPPTLQGPSPVSYVPLDLQIAAKSEWELEVAPNSDAIEIERDISQ
jgi:hypothetical protein